MEKIKEIIYMAKEVGYEQYISDSHLMNEFNISIEAMLIQKYLIENLDIRIFANHAESSGTFKFETNYMREGKWKRFSYYQSYPTPLEALMNGLYIALNSLLEIESPKEKALSISIPGISNIL